MKISRRVGMNWNFKGRRKRGGDDVGENRLRPFVSANHYIEARALIKSAQQSSTCVNNSCALSNITSVWN